MEDLSHTEPGYTKPRVVMENGVCQIIFCCCSAVDDETEMPVFMKYYPYPYVSTTFIYHLRSPGQYM